MRSYLILHILTVSLTLSVLANVDHKLSDADHFKVKMMRKDFFANSCFQGGEHDSKFDHEAFLGKDTAAEFDELTPEKSKERLA